MTTDTQFVLLLRKTRRSELFLFNPNIFLDMSLRKVFRGKGLRASKTRMPTQTAESDDIRVKIVYNGEVQITYITAGISVDTLREEMRTICGFGTAGPGSGPDQFTMKWIDDEGDPCRIASQHELDEALRLYELEKDTEITIHVFPNVPPAPGMPCQGEDRNIYRRGARRWRKLYRVNGHIFQAKRFNRRAFCAFCQDRIWGLGRQGFKCIQCKLLVHKKCHKVVRKPCLSIQQQQQTQSGEQQTADRNGDQPPPDSPQSSPPAHLEDEAAESLAAEEHPRHRPSSEDGEELALDMIAGADGNSGMLRQYSLSDFELIRVIGRGSYAKVLMVELKRTKRIYAMKVIKKALVTDDEDIDWVQTEKHVFETASNHPFLVGLHSCFQTPSRLFFVIEFVRGGDLMFHMQRKHRLEEDHARFYAAEISLALNFLHQKGIIYRDLKLDNVLLDHEGHVKLTDYGMCKEGVREGDTTATFCGTPNYIAPEILRGEDYGFSVDWWALGVLLYEMLAGRSPFDIAGASENPDQNTEDYLFQVILQKTIRIPRSLSVKAASVLKGFLSKNPLERLGCSRGSSAFLDIVSHPFFKAIDWDMLEQKQVTPPYKPRLESDRDLANFPPEFTDEPIHLTPDDPRVIDKIDQSEFEGFEYVNPLLMSLEDCV
ncbi:atypical protein kinase C isoform X2 [Venturia canescens]|uniref:atypical protein kinase C isoform X2 n=1 Tax=Venturia canescens TaxID=32260 RepID=UPI001C9C51A3|nr:atypical protein kinase C isoform X2 [Venturia canescens]